MPAGHADPQVHPIAAGAEAVFAFFAREIPRLQREWAVTMEERLEQSTGKHFESIEPRFEVTPSDVQWFDLGVVFAAETGFKLESNPDTVRAPDVAFVSRAKLQSLGVPKQYFPSAPDLAVEVVSPNDTLYDVDEKVADWLASVSVTFRPSPLNLSR